MNRKSIILSSPAVVIFWLITGALIWQIIQVNGMFVYGLDDAYIHLALAKNLAETGVLGVNAGEFASASSSPLFTGLLTLSHLFFGEAVTEWVPLILNLLGGTALLFWLSLRMQSARQSLQAALLWPVLLLFIAMLPPLVLYGMEHLIHGCAFAVAIDMFACLISGKMTLRGHVWQVMLVSIVLGGIRFEGLTILAVFLGLAWLREKNWRYILIGVLAALPVGLMIVYTYLETGYLLPNSVYMKLYPVRGNLVNLEGIKRFFTLLGANLRVSPMVVPGLLTAAFFFLNRQKDFPPFWNRRGQTFFLLWILTCLVHAMGATGVMLRYEAYLITGLVVGIALYGREAWECFLQHRISVIERRAALGVLILVGGLMWQNFAYLSVYDPMHRAVLASTNIHDQQMQTTAFVQQYYPTANIAINDLGWISYRTHAHLLDLEGLGSTEITNLNREGRYNWQEIERLFREKDIELGILYEDWYRHIGLSNEHRVATWTLEDFFILGGPTVSFYAINPEIKEALQSQLREFESQLPDRVIVRYDERP